MSAIGCVRSHKKDDDLTKCAKNLICPILSCTTTTTTTPPPPALYGEDLMYMIHEKEASLTSLYTDPDVFKSIEAVLFFAFSEARKKEWKLCGDADEGRGPHPPPPKLQYRSIINRTILCHSRINPMSIEGKRHAGYTMVTRLSIVSAIIAASFWAARGRVHPPAGERTHDNSIFVYANRVEIAMRNLVGMLASVDDKHDNPKLLASATKEAWR